MLRSDLPWLHLTLLLLQHAKGSINLPCNVQQEPQHLAHPFCTGLCMHQHLLLAGAWHL